MFYASFAKPLARPVGFALRSVTPSNRLAEFVSGFGKGAGWYLGEI
jgi:hypothetical protein